MEKTILITGGTGFLGSHLLEELVIKGYSVILLKRADSDLSKISGILEKVKFYDIDRLDNLDFIFKNETIDIIIHTATDYGRRDSDFNKIIVTNLLFPLDLLNLGISYGVQTFINSDTFWDENIELPTGLSYYAYSKKDFIRYAKKMIEISNIKLINIRLEHLYGPRDSDDKFIPYVIKNLLNNTESLDLTLGEQKKDFIYVKDAVDAYIYIINNINNINNSFEEFDLGTGKTLSIKEFLLKLKTLIMSDTRLNFGILKYRKGEPMESKANIEKLNKLGWNYKYEADEGIVETINYFKSLKTNNGK